MYMYLNVLMRIYVFWGAHECKCLSKRQTDFMSILPDTRMPKKERNEYTTTNANSLISDLETKIAIMKSDFEMQIKILTSDHEQGSKTVQYFLEEKIIVLKLALQEQINTLKADSKNGIEDATLGIIDINNRYVSRIRQELLTSLKTEHNQLMQHMDDEIRQSQRKITKIIKVMASLFIVGMLILMYFLKAPAIKSQVQKEVDTYYGVCQNMFDEKSTITSGGKLEVLDSKMDEIKHFHGENDRFWSSLFAPIRRVIKEEHPSRPAVILIATMRSSRSLAECLAHEVATLVESFFDIAYEDDPYVTLDAETLQLNPSKARTLMDKALSDNYQRPHKVAVIEDLSSLPLEAAGLLHGYCDHESARFRKAVLLATVYMKPGAEVNIDEVETYLFNCWEELEKDVLKSLLSRLANNIAVMESNGVIYDFCKLWYSHKDSIWHVCIQTPQEIVYHIAKLGLVYT